MVVNLDTGEMYKSIAEASMETRIGRNNISACCHYRHKTAGGYRWEFYKSKDEG